MPIRREAYKRITEPLNEKAKDYAHRKVIVDFPATAPTVTVDEETKKRMLPAGAAPSLAEDTLNQEGQANNSPPRTSPQIPHA